jgi:predicted glycosyltransferase
MMKIIHYCQHVLGMGHYFRSLEIGKAFSGDDVVLVSGGAPMDMPLPRHIREVQLPPLGMDPDFNRIESDAGTVEAIQAIRRQTLYRLIADERPDLFLVELYPFGRKAFGFELIPLWTAIRQGTFPPIRVVCSLRDILVEKKDVEKYESRVVSALNQWFDALLIHADPALVRLDETFSRMMDIQIPIAYTGFVTPRPDEGERTAVRSTMGITDDTRLIVVSAGGGKVGFELLHAVVQAADRISVSENLFFQVFTGPFMDEASFLQLFEMASDRVSISRFTPHFPAYLAAADLSVSMAGYNTCMNIAAARVPSLVWPFAQNREQRLRAVRLSKIGRMRILEDGDMAPRKLADLMLRSLADANRCDYPIDIDGAGHTADWIHSWMKTQRTNS